jgi:hypothetical protein
MAITLLDCGYKKPVLNLMESSPCITMQLNADMVPILGPYNAVKVEGQVPFLLYDSLL